MKKDPVFLNSPVVFSRMDPLLMPQHPHCLSPHIPTATCEGIHHPFGHLLALSCTSERHFISIFPMPQNYSHWGAPQPSAVLFLLAQIHVCSDTIVTSHQLPASWSKSQDCFLTATLSFPFPDLEHICPFAFPHHHFFFFPHWSLCHLDLRS